MLPTPKRFTLVAGSGEGNTPLTAFDSALLNAGAGNLNLIKVSSILPPQAQYDPNLSIPPGSIVPTAFGAISSSKPGEIITAAVAVGIPEEDTFGVIMEHSGHYPKDEIEKQIKNMVMEASSFRGIPLREIKIAAAEQKVKSCASVFAGLLLWY
ncbi:pyruvoyl-dependent arginine decarboxylase [Candidatus Formimonas warabiya]|uniref:Pyruvoyl-dependent arginine decarboxylase AaxB n=1 Tax=Formimonas warabiya TaxID=1761012 RepID=A0A3G1KPH6_FORW1|nr:arginine decarboxylase, pyruvoyl-dependent [Candidatus Formimonas warabiya]ATW24330.1 arginine decarboxylase, pyruvoyl-dependent [Candidatus Formimonas warabiya]